MVVVVEGGHSISSRLVVAKRLRLAPLLLRRLLVRVGAPCSS